MKTDKETWVCLCVCRNSDSHDLITKRENMRPDILLNFYEYRQLTDSTRSARWADEKSKVVFANFRKPRQIMKDYC